MTHTSFTGLLSRKKVVRYLIYLLFVCVFAVFVFKLNQVEKTELVVRTGQTFEKAEVTEILQDNLDSNGTRVGEQKVRVKMLTGARKGEELDITSSSGYLFGATCKVGMKVIVMQSVAGETTIASVYSQDREWVIYIFALLYLLALCVIGGKQGIKGCLGLIFTFFCVDLCLSSLRVSTFLRSGPLFLSVFSPHWSLCTSSAVLQKRPAQRHLAHWQALFWPVFLPGASVRHPASPATMYLISRHL